MSTVEDILLEKGSDVIGTIGSVSVRDAVRKMVEANVGCLIIEEGEKTIGVFTERDLLRRVVDAGKDPETTLISEVMSSPVNSCQASQDITKVANDLVDHKFRHLVVMDKAEPVGVISLRDLPAWLIKER